MIGRVKAIVTASVAGLLVLSGAYTVGRLHGGQAQKRAEAERQVRAARVAAKREAKAEAITEAVRTDVAKARVRVQTVTRTIVKEVPIYVTQAADRRCELPDGFVRVHDAAASGVSPAAGGPVDAPSGVPLSAVAATVAENYGIAHEWRIEALAWRDWYSRQKAEWDRR